MSVSKTLLHKPFGQILASLSCRQKQMRTPAELCPTVLLASRRQRTDIQQRTGWRNLSPLCLEGNVAGRPSRAEVVAAPHSRSKEEVVAMVKVVEEVNGRHNLKAPACPWM